MAIGRLPMLHALRHKSKSKSAVDVAKRLRMFRHAAGLTQETLGRRARLGAKYISEIENGHTNPSVDVLCRLVEDGLGLPLAAFFATAAPDELRDDLARLAALFASQPAAVRRRALRILQALCED